MTEHTGELPGSERSAAFHELLSTLTQALDVREVFQHLTETAQRIVLHDDASLSLSTDDGATFRLYASTMDGDAEVIHAGEPFVIQDPSVPRVLRDGVGSEQGFQSVLRVPVLANGKPIGVLVFLSLRQDAYSEQELALAQRIADYVAVGLSHQRLAELARRASVDSSVDLLRTISEVLDIRRVFPRVSEIANRVLPHDYLHLVFQGQAGHVSLQAASHSDFPAPGRMILSQDLAATHFRIEGDLRTTTLPVTDPPDFQDRVLAAGYRSILAVTSRARDQQMGLGFWSKRPNAYSLDDLPAARRIADYIALAVSHEQLAEAERNAAEARARAERLEHRVKTLAEELELKSGLGRAIGHSREWQDVLKKATQVAAVETTALLQGESGTGKEVVARFIHRASPRKDGPFVAINCAALPEQLLESELFGYERGAFTGAQQAKPGQIELAAGGVLFLDEVSEMSPSAQAKFLRVLQEREFQRLGGTRPLKAHVRVIAATNRDLLKAVERGTFREDLYYRLQVFEIRIPPLRDRKGDVPALAAAFLEDIGRSFGRPPAGLTQEAKNALLAHDWPGNVRELRNALERAVILSDGGLITKQHLSLHTERLAVTGETTDLNSVERQTIEQVMREMRGNKSKAAKRLGLTRTQLYGRLRKYGLETADS
ncbi:MAG TPA: sigma 54-interacting transcriptional regulator [Vicinamibacterales bacterium]|jgi:transcriptional regulator with GAF, ATPase, and Fis domain|nr:sigma 54-interacting transcriptional regulator [Vicinamibacterales bacterium]